MRTRTRWLIGISAYLLIGVILGAFEAAHQAKRFDPGFDPSFVFLGMVVFWPVWVYWHLRG